MLTDLIHPLHLAFALGPLAGYLFLLSLLNLSSRPFVTTGSRDAAALGVGLSGLIIMGPLHLLLPTATMFQFGTLTWLVLLIFYTLVLTLTVLVMRPRLVIYNIAADRIRPVLASLVTELDSDARWAGESLVLPKLGVQMHVETVAVLRNVQLVAAGSQQNYEGWRRLEVALAQALRESGGQRGPLGYSLLVAGLLLTTVIGYCLVKEADTVDQSVQEMLESVGDP